MKITLDGKHTDMVSYIDEGVKILGGLRDGELLSSSAMRERLDINKDKLHTLSSKLIGNTHLTKERKLVWGNRATIEYVKKIGAE